MKVHTGPGGVEARPVPPNCSTRSVRALLYNFDIDDALLKPQHQKWLDDNVVPFLATATRIALLGTTSRSGPDQYNQGLSERRVKTVKDYLLLRGASPSVIVTSAVGEQAAARAGERDGTEDPRFRAVEVSMETPTPVVVTVTVRVHLLDRFTRQVPSILGANGKDHFVAPKNANGVILEAIATGPCGPPANVTWEALDEANVPIPIISPGVGNDPLTVRLPSDVSRKIRVRLLSSGSPLWEGFVWLVYSNITATPRPNLLTSTPTDLTIGQGFNFTHTITPPSIISTTDDVPNFTGPKTTALPDGTNHAGNSLQGGADRKWDNSRKIRKKFVNPSNIPLASIGGNPSFHTTFPNYPSAADGDGHPGGAGAIDPDLVPIVGNDDASVNDPEDNDPYTDPNKGKLTGTDRPSRSIDHSVGADGDTLEWRLQFIEFTRLELSGKWVRISDDFPWRTHIRMKRVAGQWVDNGSLKELNNNGF
jgi:hypothetical protein